MIKKTDSEKQANRHRGTVLLAIVAGFSIILLNSAVWLNTNLFSKDNFVEITTKSITSQSSREAIANEITGRIYEDRPVADRFLGDYSQKLIAAILDTNRFESALEVTSSKVHTALTTEEKQDVTIDLTGIKDNISVVSNINFITSDESKIRPENIPDEVVLLRKDSVPSLYTFGLVSLWITPVALIIAVFGIVYPYIKREESLTVILAIHGLVVTIFGLLALFIGPLTKPIVGNIAADENISTVILNLYDAFVAKFNNQTIIIVYAGILMLVTSAAIKYYPKFKGVFQK